MDTPELPANLRALLERVVEHPLGFQLLYKGHLESVAALFSVTPGTIEIARTWILDPVRRRGFTEALVAARRFHHEHPEIDHIHGRGPAPPVPPRKTVEELIRDVEALPDGIQFLFCAAPETVAVLFGVHPFVVHEACRHLRERGIAPHANEGPD